MRAAKHDAETDQAGPGVRVVVVARVAALRRQMEHVGKVLIGAAAQGVATVIAVIVIIARGDRTADNRRARQEGHEFLALLVIHVAALDVNKGARSQVDAGAGCDAPLLEGLVASFARTVDAAILSRRPPEGAFAAEHEASEVEIDAGRSAPAPMRLAPAFRTEAADARLGLSPETTKALGVCLARRDAKRQGESGNYAGV